MQYYTICVVDEQINLPISGHRFLNHPFNVALKGNVRHADAYRATQFYNLTQCLPEISLVNIRQE